MGMHWVVLSLLSMLLTGVGNFFFKQATLAGQSPLAVVMLVFCMDMLVAVLLWALWRPPVSMGLMSLVWPLLAGLCTGVGILLFIRALSLPQAPTGVVAAIMNANFAVVVLLSLLILKEPVTFKQVLGLLAVAGGLLLLI